jgi:hypothetical protein
VGLAQPRKAVWACPTLRPSLSPFTPAWPHYGKRPERQRRAGLRPSAFSINHWKGPLTASLFSLLVGRDKFPAPTPGLILYPLDYRLSGTQAHCPLSSPTPRLSFSMGGIRGIPPLWLDSWSNFWLSLPFFSTPLTIGFLRPRRHYGKRPERQRRAGLRPSAFSINHWYG